MKRLAYMVFALIMISLLLGAAVQLQKPNELPAAERATFERANQLYEAGQYLAAANLYEQLVAKDIVNADLFYNLGQAYTQAGKVQQANVYYQRAAELAPRDEQIAAKYTSNRLPLTANEWLLGALFLASVTALAVTGLRHGWLVGRRAQAVKSRRE